MFSKFFWIRAGERAAKTFAQALVTIISADKVAGFFNANWKEVLGTALFMTLLSFLTSFASTTVGNSDSPSLVEDTIEQQVVEKIEAGEEVGIPPKVVDEPLKAAPRKRQPRKKV